MIAFAYYLLKVIVCSGILYGYYLLALRNRIFHHWNRYYLLSALLLSITLPFIRIPVQVEQQQALSPALQILQMVSTSDDYVRALNVQGGYILGWKEVSTTVYLLVCLFLFTVMVQGFYRIRQMIRSNPVSRYGDFRLVSTSAKGAPFSFLRHIFWHEKIPLDSSTGQQILKHEMAHIREKHSYDKVFIQAILAVYWINPFFWLIRRELGMIHEFTADQQSVEQGDTAAFAAMVLQAAYPQHQLPLMNQFFHSPIQRRLHMLLKSQNKKVTYFSRILALPLLAAIGIVFTVKAQRASAQEATVMKNIEITMSSNEPWNAKGLANPLIVFNGEKMKLEQLLNKTIKAETATLYDAGSASAFHKFGKDAKDGAWIFENASLTEVKGSSSSDGVKISGSAHAISDTGHPVVKVNTDGQTPEPLYVIDGMIINKSVERDALNLMAKPDQIERIDVLKGSAASTIYGEKGKNGVVVITTRRQSAEDRVSGIAATDPPELTSIEVTDHSPVFTSVEVPASFPGGEEAMVKWIREQVAAQQAVKSNPADFKGLAGLRFIVNTVGQITNVSLLNENGKTYNARLGLLVASLLQKGPYWLPAEQHGKKVRSFRDIELNW